MLMVVADISASESAKRVYLIAGFLAAVGIALAVLTIWFWRSTRADPASLAPLEVMSDRKFAKLDQHARQRKLNEVRRGPAWVPTPAAATEIDLTAAARGTPVGFDDLREDVAEPTPPGADDAPPAADGTTTSNGDDDTVATPAPAPTAAPIDPLLARSELDAPAPAGDRG